MSEVIKQSMVDIWASIGDIVMPDVEKIAEGWAVEVVPRQYWNWMQNRTDTNLAYLFQHGIPEWDATVEYITNKSYVTYADVVYKAILTGTNQNPATQPTYWKVAFATSTAALEALKALTPAADKLPYFSGPTTATTTTITSLARSLLDDTTQSAMLSTIGAQAADATLTALAGVPTATNKLPYFSGVDTATTTDLTSFGRSLIDDVDALSARTTLDLVKTTSTTDATVGSMLKVGDFGVGNMLSVSTFDAIVSSGFALVTIGAGDIAQSPTGATGQFLCTTVAGSAVTTAEWQVAQLRGQDRIFTRHKNTTTWSAWVEIIKAGDYGVGATVLDDVGNLDSFALGTGNYRFINGTSTGTPPIAVAGVVRVEAAWPNVIQTFTQITVTDVVRSFIRHGKGGNSWSSWVEMATDANSFGQKQTWQNMTASRAFGTTYTNSSGKPIEVAVTTNSLGTGTGALSVTVSGNGILTISTDYRANATFVVPDNATYSITATTFTLAGWHELR